MSNVEVTTPPRDAATVLMLRDAAHDLEVFLVKRHGLSDVLAGAFVFPGGKLDAADSEPDNLRHLDETPDELQLRLAETDTENRRAAGLYVAALREALEESGVLFAHGADRQSAARAAAMARAGTPFATVLETLALRLSSRALVPWTRWITPRVPTVTNRRFDTRFFVAALPEGQDARHDEHEAVDSIWLRPRDALRLYWDGTIDFAPPQIMSLAHLSHYRRVDDVLAAARSVRPAIVLPEPFELLGERVICYPGDTSHPVAVRAMPGPTRLWYRNRRFEPEGGFDALFSPPPE